MGKQYRTASGKTLDMEALALKNELTPAVGNMDVNARGDKIDSERNIIKTRAEIMKEYHQLHTPVPTDEPVRQSALKEDEFDDE